MRVSSGSRSQDNRPDLGGEWEAPRNNLVHKGRRLVGIWSVQELVQGSIGYFLLSTPPGSPSRPGRAGRFQRWKEEPTELLDPPALSILPTQGSPVIIEEPRLNQLFVVLHSINGRKKLLSLLIKH